MCFRAERQCGDECVCRDCCNDGEHEDLRVAAWAKIQAEMGSSEMAQGDVKCKCKQSGCIKKYCDCFAAQTVCSASCSCQGCKNSEPSVLWGAECGGSLPERKQRAFLPEAHAMASRPAPVVQRARVLPTAARGGA